MDDAQEKPRPGPPREVPPRDDVHVAGSPVRCPFCHDDVAIEGEWSACSRCLARHHQPCWTEGRRSAACGHDGAVRHEREAKKPDEAARRRSTRAIVGALLVVVFGFVGLVFLGYLGAVSAHNARLEERRAQQQASVDQLAWQVRRQRPAARYEEDGALVVVDGRGNFVAVIEAEDAVVFGLGAELRMVDETKVEVDVGGGHTYTAWRPLKPLHVYVGRDGARSGTESARRAGLKAGEVARILRQTRPPELDIEYLLEQVRGD